jgi:hypothetical protein
MSIPADEAAAYPVFTADQLDRLRAYGTVRSARAGEVLFSPADETYDLLVVLLTDVFVPPDRAPARPRLPYETAMDGLFAAGDIRVGSMKRVAAAVGEGSSAIRSVHQYLAQFPDRDSVG